MTAAPDLAASLISLPCPDCAAPPGQDCEPYAVPGRELIMISRDPLLLAHAARVLAAIETGAVTRDDVTARFGPGTAPAWLTGDAAGTPASQHQVRIIRRAAQAAGLLGATAFIFAVLPGMITPRETPGPPETTQSELNPVPPGYTALAVWKAGEGGRELAAVTADLNRAAGDKPGSRTARRDGTRMAADAARAAEKPPPAGGPAHDSYTAAMTSIATAGRELAREKTGPASASMSSAQASLASAIEDIRTAGTDGG